MAHLKSFIKTGVATRILVCQPCAAFSTSHVRPKQKSYKMLIVGGGTAGTAAANRFVNKFPNGQMAILEPHESHYYQAMWTLVGGGIKRLENSRRDMASVLPKKADWIKENAASFDPDRNIVTTASGDEIKYDYLVIAMGLKLNYDQIKGLPEALANDPQVCSNYKHTTVVKTKPAMEAFSEGNAIFTFPNTQIKCAGAPQKIMYLFEHYMQQNGKREKANIMFNSALGVIFGVPKYADALSKICDERNITVNLGTNLVEVNWEKREAVFENLDTKEKTTYPYSFLHAVPPMATPDALRLSPLVDETGFVSVTKETLQHTKYPNVFSLGDCSNVPTSKTAAAVSGQVAALGKTLTGVMEGSSYKGQYDGYTSCPLVTSYGKCILAEFGFDAKVLETFPVDQGKERTSMYLLKTRIMPELYWHGLLRGVWPGPKYIRKALRLGMSD